MAGAVELATAYIALVPSMKGASQKISEQLTPAAHSAGSEGGSSLGSALLGGIKKFALPIAGVVAAFSIGKLVKDSTEQFESYAGAVKGFGRLAGGTVEQFSGLRGAMQLSGVDVNSATGAITIFSKNLGKAGQDSTKTAAMTKLLGESFKDAHGNIKPMSELLPGLSDKFKSMPDGAAKTALATQLFGRAGAQMLPFLNKGSAGIAELTGEAKKMGLVLDDTSMRIFGDAKKSAREYTTSLQGMKLQLGQSLTPALDAVHNLFRSFMIPIIQTATKVFAAAREPVMHFAEGIQAMADRVRAGMTGIITLFSTGKFTGGLRKALGLEEDSAVVGTVLGIRDGIIKGFNGIKGAFELLKTGNFTGGIRKAMGIEEDSSVVGAILKIRDTFLAVKETARELFEGIKTGAAFVGPSVAGAFGGIGNKIHDAFLAAKETVRELFEGMKTGSAFVGPSVAGTFGKIGNTIHSVFGSIKSTLAGIDFGGIFRGIASTVGPLIPQIVSLAGAFSPVQLIFKSIQPLLPQLLGVFVQLATVIGGTLGTALKTLLPAFIQLQGVFVKVFQQVLAIVLPVVVKLITMLGQTLAQLIPIVVPIVTKIATLAATLVGQLAPILMHLVSAVMPMVVTIFGALLAAIGPVIQIVAGVLMPAIQALMPVVVTVFGVIANVITTVMQIIMGIIQVVTGIITGNWSMVWEGIKNIFAGVWNTIVALVNGVFAILGSIISSALNFWFGLISGVLRNIGNFFASTWSNVVNGVSSMIGQVGGFFSGLWGTVTGALSGAGTWLFNAGRNIIDGLISGIGSMMGAIGNAILSLIPGPIVGVFKAALGIQSPSKVFRGFGKNIVEGLILGTGDKTDELGSTMRDLVTVPAVPSFGSPSASIAGRSGRNGGATFNTTINQVDDPIGTAHAVARRQFALSS